MKKFFFGTLYFLALSLFLTPSLQAHEDPSTKCCKTFGGFYTKDDSEIDRGQAIAFDHNIDDIAPSGGISHSPGSSDITLRFPGIYRVTFSVSLKDDGRVALTLDGDIIPGSEMFVGGHEHLSTLSVLVKVCHTGCGRVLRLINNSHHHEGWFKHDEIRLKAGHDHQNVTASILIERLANCPHCCDPDRSLDPCGNDPCCSSCCDEANQG